jgi:hypothetical protein
VRVTVQQRNPGDLSNADWELLLTAIDAIKQAIPDHGSRQPGEISQIICDAMKLYVTSIAKPKKK